MHFCTHEVKGGKKKKITNAEKIILNVSHRGFALKKLSAFQTSDEQKSQGISAGKLNADRKCFLSKRETSCLKL